MGQTYNVEFFVKTENKNAVANLLRGYIVKNDGRAVFSRERLDTSFEEASLDELMKIILTDDVSVFPPETEMEGTIYEDEFDGSYGWESVMLDAFEAMAPALQDGSYIKIWPDNEFDYVRIHNGKIETLR